jgi:hypothetical protein
MVSYTRSKLRIRGYRKTRRRMRGGDILPEDIMYQDNDVCILRPEVKKGVLVFSNYVQPKNSPSLCETGLKSGKQLHNEGINFGRVVYHPYIFFRAPFYSNPIDYSSIDTEIESSFGKDLGNRTRVWIRVDPDRTYIYSSELRMSEARERMLRASRKTMTNYLKIIGENRSIVPGPEQVPKYHLVSSQKMLFPKRARPFRFLNNSTNYNNPFSRFSYNNNKPNYNSMINTQPIERNSEVLVAKNHLTPEYFVRCT